MSISVGVIIFLVVCMALGPVLLLQPSRRQRQVARFRAAAAQRGIAVRMTEHEDRSVAAYELPWPSGTGRKFKGPQFSLGKRGYEHDLHIARVWEVRPPHMRAAAAAAAEDLITSLPATIVGLTVSAHGLALHWLERGDRQALDTVETLLRTGVKDLWPRLSVVKSSAQAERELRSDLSDSHLPES